MWPVTDRTWVVTQEVLDRGWGNTEGKFGNCEPTHPKMADLRAQDPFLSGKLLSTGSRFRKTWASL